MPLPAEAIDELRAAELLERASALDQRHCASALDQRQCATSPEEQQRVQRSTSPMEDVEALEAQAQAILDGEASAPNAACDTVFAQIRAVIFPLIAQSTTREIEATLTGLSGGFVPPGPSGAPTRRRLDVLPTGRNFYSVDTRSVPTQAAKTSRRRWRCWALSRSGIRRRVG